MKDGMLTLTDAPMFGRVMKDPDICKEVLESILGFEIERIEYLNTEQSFDPATDAKGVRLDVFAKATGKVFDIEIQTSTEAHLGKRMRYYQSSLDQVGLDKGTDYDLLDESYIIFICTEDPYEQNIAAYHIERACKETEINVDDKSHWLVLNASAWDKDREQARSELLQYIYLGSTSNALTEKLDRAVNVANSDAEWRKKAMGFMTLEHDMRVRYRTAYNKGIEEGYAIGEEQGMEQGREEGREQGEARYAKLVDVLLDTHRIDDLKRAAEDSNYRESLFQELDYRSLSFHTI